MKKLLVSGAIASLLLPALAFAAYNDVSLDNTVVLTVNSITLNVSGSAAAIESIVVNPTNFVVTIKNGSSFQVTAPGRESLSASTGYGQSVSTCNGTYTLPVPSTCTQTLTTRGSDLERRAILNGNHKVGRVNNNRLYCSGRTRDI